MPNEHQMLAGAGLEKWFGGWIASLVSAVRYAADTGGSHGFATQNVSDALRTIRTNAAPGTVGLEAAIDVVSYTLLMVESEADNLHDAGTDLYQRRRVEAARAAAISACSRLAEILRDAEPSDEARAVYPQPGEPGYHPPEPV